MSAAAEHLGRSVAGESWRNFLILVAGATGGAAEAGGARAADLRETGVPTGSFAVDRCAD